MLHADEVAEALAVAAEFDSREVTPSTCRAWKSALDHAEVSYDELMAAVPMFYAEPDSATRRITPADVIRIAGQIRIDEYRERKRREDRIRHAPYPNGVTYDDVREGRAPLPEGFPPPPDSTVRDRTADLARLISGAFPRMPGPDDPPDKLIRDDPERLHALLEAARIAPDGHERWSLTGDPQMRARQANWNPELAAARHASLQALARERLAESTTDYARRRRGEIIPGAVAEESAPGADTDQTPGVQ